ncbi:MAG: DNA repair protein RecN [Prevotella sp.]|nr:DNA repair protein RecN [Prevotella sp.]
MLARLYIKSFALIDELDISFGAGFSVVTGETGAGKSIILGALGLLAGNRADVKAIKEGVGKCVVEACFDVPDEQFRTLLADNDIDTFGAECIIRREINTSGRSRAFVNDTPVGLSLLKEISERLIDIHSQHRNLLLKDNTFQLSVVDTIAADKNLLARYTAAFKAYNEAKNTLRRTREETEQNRRNIDFIRFQYNELSALNLADGEQERLERAANAMQHAEDIKRALYETDNNLTDEQTGILVRLHNCLTALKSIAPLSAGAEEAHDRIDALYVDAKDIASDIAAQLAQADFDPAETERITARLDAIYTLEKKHSAPDIAALLRLQDKFKEDIDKNENSDTLIEELEKRLNEARADCLSAADELSAARRNAVGKIETEMLDSLVRLGLQGVRFKVDIAAKELSADGKDRVEFLFSANPGVPLRAVSDVASGGEIARVMLALKAMLSGAAKLPTIIFDEIDTGVSGKIAEQMAVTMKRMSEKDRQVINITHLPQIAAYGETHYKVYKEQDGNTTTTRMKRLTTGERIEEIAQMLSGNSVSEAAIGNAKKLLGLA